MSTTSSVSEAALGQVRSSADRDWDPPLQPPMMKQVLIASIVPIITTASDPSRLPDLPRLAVGIYAANVSNSENTSFAGVELIAKKRRGGTVVDITFEEQGGKRFTFNGIPLRRMVARGSAWGAAKLRRECYALKMGANSGPSISQWFRMVMEKHPMHGRVTAGNFLMCPASDGSVVLKLLTQERVYSDVRLPLTVGTPPRIIKPGRYLMLKGDRDKFDNLVYMKVGVSGDAPGSQTADLIFYHKNGEKYIINNLRLASPPLPLIDVLGKDREDRCFGLNRGHRQPLGSNRAEFERVHRTFGEDLKDFWECNSFICVVDEYSIVVTFPDIQAGLVRMKEVSLLLDSGNLHMLGDIVIREGKRELEDDDDDGHLTQPESNRSRLA
ncbi:hypothetical protein FOZ63_023580 [Perkinsus olseni]|uniref:Uncharacterized protein n=1 Tax=Perkinsus olseni TaxID=32597 RepID=A0A7J6TCP9_PEROL|nr:hypothetical protein FOZ63_023580 [Perkinsus olseni]KAF4742532.1 hypothetical protein FOZ62_016903 [Perkinsus olseni]